MKRSFICSQWFLLSSETTASRVGGGKSWEEVCGHAEVKFRISEMTLIAFLEDFTCTNHVI